MVALFLFRSLPIEICLEDLDNEAAFETIKTLLKGVLNQRNGGGAGKIVTSLSCDCRHRSSYHLDYLLCSERIVFP